MSYPKISIISTEFNADLTQMMVEDAKTYLLSQNIPETQLNEYRVPGALELPLSTKWAIESGTHGVLCFGVVIRGETTHYDEVCRGCISNLQTLMLDTGIPILTGVLTTETRNQALRRINGEKGKKGLYCAKGLLNMLELHKKFQNA